PTSKPMSRSTREPALLQGARRIRYLKLIALFKIAKAATLLLLGISLLFVNARARWMDGLSNWTADEILMKHSPAVGHLFHKLQGVLESGTLRATGLLTIFFTEGIGVYLQQRWAEWLMIIATGALIPIELRHIWHRPSLAAVLILIVNCFIVWFLYFVLRRQPSTGPRSSQAFG